MLGALGREQLRLIVLLSTATASGWGHGQWVLRDANMGARISIVVATRIRGAAAGTGDDMVMESKIVYAAVTGAPIAVDVVVGDPLLISPVGRRTCNESIS